MNPVVNILRAAFAPAEPARGWRDLLDELLKRWRQLGRVEVDMRGLVHLSVGLGVSAWLHP